MIGRVTLGVVLTLGLSLALLGQNAQEIYQRALVQEQAVGDLKQAIAAVSTSRKRSRQRSCAGRESIDSRRGFSGKARAA